jgi:hypothetical protein
MIEAEAAGTLFAFYFFEREEDGKDIDVRRPEFLAVLLAVFLGDRQDLYLSGNALLVLAEEIALVQVIDFLKQGSFG